MHKLAYRDLRFNRLGARKAQPGGGGGVVVVTRTLQTIQNVTSFDAGGGVVLTFSGPTNVATYEDGSVAIMTTSAGSLTGLTPVSAVVDGYTAYGLQRNIYSAPGGIAPQGLDEIMTTYPGSDTVVRIPWDAALNEHPAIAGPLSWSVGDEFSMTLGIRRTGSVLSAVASVIDRLVNITFTSQPVYVGGFTPSQAATSKASPLFLDEIDISRLPQLAPYSGMVDAETALARSYPEVLTGHVGESKQRITTLWKSGVAEYEASAAGDRADTYHFLCSNASDAVKLPILKNVLRHAVAIEAVVSRGQVYGNGAGQFFDKHLALITAYCVTHNQKFLDAAKLCMTVPFVGHAFNNLSEVGLPTPWLGSGPGNGYRLAQTVFAEEVGRPRRIGIRFNTQIGARYADVSMRGAVAEWLPAMLMQFPEGPAWQVLSTGAHANAALFAASVEHAKLLSTIGGKSFYGSNAPLVRHCNAWSEWSGSMTFVSPDRTPAQIDVTWSGGSPVFNNQNVRATGGTGAVTFDYSDFPDTLAVHPVTSVDYFISPDGIQKTVFVGKGFNPTISELSAGVPIPGNTYSVGVRRANAFGNSIWSPSFRYTDAPASNNLETRNPRFSVTVSPASTTPAAPLNAVAPLLHYDDSPRWGGENFVVFAGGTLPNNTLGVAVGDGIWTGYPYPTITRQWQRNTGTIGSPVWSNITGATDNRCSFQPDDIAKQVRCTISGANASGSSAAIITASVNGPPALVLDPGVIINTDFQNDWSLYYPTLAANSYSTAGTLVHAKSVSWGDLDTSIGGLITSKTAQYPRIAIDLGTLAAGTYRIRADVPVGMSTVGANKDWLQRVNFNIYNAITGGTVLNGVIINANTAGVPRLEKIDLNITIASSTRLRVDLFLNSGVGGTVGGDPGFSYLRVETV